jgi:hypothetical protein
MISTTASGKFLTPLIIWKGSESMFIIIIQLNISDGNLSKNLQKKWKGQVLFAQNENAWMKTSVFRWYLRQLFPGNPQTKKLLLVDTASAHGYLRQTGGNLEIFLLIFHRNFQL